MENPKNIDTKANPVKGYLYAIAAALLWGVAGPVAKYLFNSGVTALTLTQVRMTLSFVFLMAFFLIGRRDLARVRARDIPYLAVLGLAGLALVQISYYSAIANIHVAAAILLQYMAPIFILFYAATFMKEKITPELPPIIELEMLVSLYFPELESKRAELLNVVQKFGEKWFEFRFKDYGKESLPTKQKDSSILVTLHGQVRSHIEEIQKLLVDHVEA